MNLLQSAEFSKRNWERELYNHTWKFCASFAAQKSEGPQTLQVSPYKVKVVHKTEYKLTSNRGVDAWLICTAKGLSRFFISARLRENTFFKRNSGLSHRLL